MAQGVRGTRDFYPDEMRVRNWLFGMFHSAARTHGFEEYDAPVLESEELYTRKAGEEITQQLYNFEDKGGRKVSLRPEMTPSLARMVMARSGALALPIKWYSIPQCWRYERTQRGRGREHYQWNVDIWGSEELTADVELLSVLTHFFQGVGLSQEDVVIKVSSRKVLEEVLGSQGVVGVEFEKACVIIDKLDRLPAEAIAEQLSDLGIEEGSIEVIQSVLSSKKLDDLQNSLDPDSEAVSELVDLFSLIDAYDFSDWVQFDASVVRGLAYYTGPVFEVHDRAGELRAICGGGRYDRLIGTLGGKDLPATGFGFGDMVILELLESKGLTPELGSEVDDVVFGMGENLRGPAMQVAKALREKGRKVDLVLEEKRMKWVFRHSDRLGAERLVMVMPDEWKEGKIRVKSLNDGQESDVPFEEL